MKRKNQTSILQFSKKREAKKIVLEAEQMENKLEIAEEKVVRNDLEKENEEASLQENEANS